MNRLSETYAPDDFADMSTLSPVASAVSWGAIMAGAAAAAALSLILLLLGTGLGLSSVSPWARDGASATTFGFSAILWLTFTQLVASAMGGYLAGRLRTRWLDVQVDEVYFRDTAHGFLAWAVASLATAALLTSAISSIVGGGVKAGAPAAGGVARAEAAQSDQGSGEMAYVLDSLFRSDASTAGAAAPAEAARIFMCALRTGTLPADDTRHVGQVVAQRTGLGQAEAEKRVNASFARVQTTLGEAETAAKKTADTARKASAYMALWLFISLLIGAFVASFAATYGGQQRDL